MSDFYGLDRTLMLEADEDADPFLFITSDAPLCSVFLPKTGRVSTFVGLPLYGEYTLLLSLLDGWLAEFEA